MDPEEFAELKTVANDLGFRHVESGPLVKARTTPTSKCHPDYNPHPLREDHVCRTTPSGRTPRRQARSLPTPAAPGQTAPGRHPHDTVSAPAAPAPAAESTVTPRGLEGLRAESGGVEPRGFGSLGLSGSYRVAA